MPLPLPNLDTRRWEDLVEEGRALIPRYAKQWTDQNIHDPGITLIELFAWLIEQEIYYINRIPESHLHKYLSLIGFELNPPVASRSVLQCSTTSVISLERNTPLIARKNEVEIPFRTLQKLEVLPVELKSILTQDSEGEIYPASLNEHSLISPFGASPNAKHHAIKVDTALTLSDLASQHELSPESLMSLNGYASEHVRLTPGQRAQIPSRCAIYFGIAAEPESIAGREFSLWLKFESHSSGTIERERLLQEHDTGSYRVQVETCLLPSNDCASYDFESLTDPLRGRLPSKLLNHHSVRTIWETFTTDAGGSWRPIKVVLDDTRGFSLDGCVKILLPENLTQHTLPGYKQPFIYLRCRLDSGEFDAPPVLRAIVPNGIEVEQSRLNAQVFPSNGLASNSQAQLPIEMIKWDAVEFVVDMQQVNSIESNDLIEIISADTSTTALNISQIGSGNGRPKQQYRLSNAPINGNSVRVWTFEDDQFISWKAHNDFYSSGRMSRHFVIDLMSGEIQFGDGEHGRVVPTSAPLFASYTYTQAGSGAVGASSTWTLNESVPGFTHMKYGFERQAGQDEESIQHAFGRVAADLWASERLHDICVEMGCETLDQLDRESVLKLELPARAATLHDIERLALATPGTQISRVRAWRSMDPLQPCVNAPGVVTLVVVPYLPTQKPVPSPGLLGLVKRYIKKRSVLGSRLVVVGPQYIEISVLGTVRLKAGFSAIRVQTDIQNHLSRMFDPLAGGPSGQGWPFGRDVYRSEVLQLIDQVEGVDHVIDLSLSTEKEDRKCNNLCVGFNELVVSGTHEIELLEGNGHE
jgi:hypothetical protein